MEEQWNSVHTETSRVSCKCIVLFDLIKCSNVNHMKQCFTKTYMLCDCKAISPRLWDFSSRLFCYDFIFVGSVLRWIERNQFEWLVRGYEMLCFQQLIWNCHYWTLINDKFIAPIRKSGCSGRKSNKSFENRYKITNFFEFLRNKFPNIKIITRSKISYENLCFCENTKMLNFHRDWLSFWIIYSILQTIQISNYQTTLMYPRIFNPKTKRVSNNYCAFIKMNYSMINKMTWFLWLC